MRTQTGESGSGPSGEASTGSGLQLTSDTHTLTFHFLITFLLLLLLSLLPLSYHWELHRHTTFHRVSAWPLAFRDVASEGRIMSLFSQ